MIFHQWDSEKGKAAFSLRDEHILDLVTSKQDDKSH